MIWRERKEMFKLFKIFFSYSESFKHKMDKEGQQMLGTAMFFTPNFSQSHSRENIATIYQHWIQNRSNIQQSKNRDPIKFEV